MHRSLKTSAVLVAASALAVAMTSAATDATAAGVTVVTTPSSAAAQGWFTESGASAPVFDSSLPTDGLPGPIDGLGQLRYDTPTAADKSQLLHVLPTGTGWGAAQGLAYDVLGTGTGAEAAYNMELEATGTSGFTTLVWEPYQNGEPINGTGAWQTLDDLEGGLWWSSHFFGTGAGSQSSPQPLAFFETAWPNAAILDYGVSQGSSNAGSTTYVDDVAFNDVTTNFEPDLSTACVASGVHIQAPRAVVVGVSNPATWPCATDHKTVLAARVTLIPGLFGVHANVGVIRTATAALGTAAAASSDIASVTVTALGLRVVISGLHAQSAASVSSCGATPNLTGSSYVGTVTVNGHRTVIGSNPVTIKLGLGLALKLNQHLVVGNTITQRAVLLTGKTGAYRTALAEAISGVAC